jgi:hypothetical protein
MKTSQVAGRTSVVVVNYRGADDTITCVEQLAKLDSGDVEVICVDNASGDGSAERIRATMPTGTVLIESSVNGGFTGGCNRGAASATGEFIAFINNDARPHHEWLTAALAVLRSDATIGAVASKVLDWDGSVIDYVDAGLTWFGMGYKPAAGSLDDASHDTPRDVLFATGSAMIVRATLFRDLGGFDERLFMFYEDVDFGWRLNLTGARVRYVPASLVFHRHHATMAKFGAYREWYLLERNALVCMYKNLEQQTLDRVLAPAMALAIRRSLVSGAADSAALDLARTPGGDDLETLEVTKRSLAGSYAIDGFLELLPALNASRASIQAARVRTDRQLARLMREPIEPAMSAPHYLAGHAALVDAFGIADLYPSASRVLVVTGDPLGARMAGPAIRAFHIAGELARENDVRLVSTRACSLTAADFNCSFVPVSQIREQVEWAEVVVFQGFLLHDAPWLEGTGKILVPDLYDPMHLERLEQTRGVEPAARARDITSTLDVVNAQLRRGDFFLCANERQRHFWLGQLAAVGRLNPQTYDNDQNLQGLVAIAPFGLAAHRPADVRPAIKSVVPGIAATDKVVLWAGGIYDWFDPVTLVHAIAQVAERHDDVRLFFLGTHNPNPGVPPMPIVNEVRDLAESLGLLDRVVYFNDGWVDYDERFNFLADADVGVSTHFDHIETTFSFRTRILDYLWAGLPIVATRGDYFGDLVASQQLGMAVEAGDVDGLAAALERCLYDEYFAASCRHAVERLRPRFEWSETLRPLVEFCRAPRRAFDAEPASARAFGSALPRLRRDVALARGYLGDGGLPQLAKRVAGRLRRIVIRG